MPVHHDRVHERVTCNCCNWSEPVTITFFIVCGTVLVANVLRHTPAIHSHNDAYVLYISSINETLQESYKNWHPYHQGDSGVDLFVENDVLVQPGRDTAHVEFNVVVLMTKNGFPTSYYLYARSSLSLLDLQLVNPVGVMDAGYRGHLFVRVRSFSQDSQFISSMSRIAQICAPDLTPISEVRVVKTLPRFPSTRDSAAFGSTG